MVIAGQVNKAVEASWAGKVERKKEKEKKKSETVGQLRKLKRA